MRLTLEALLVAALLVSGVYAQDEAADEAPVAAPAVSAAPTIAAALAEASEEVKTFNDHVVTLSSPWMEGRLPGTRGMELAKEYMEWHLKKAGLEPGFATIEPDASGVEVARPNTSWRQKFELGGRSTIKSQSLTSGTAALEAKADYVATGMGRGGDVSGPLVFVGYGVERGPNDYTSFEEKTDLTGKVALMLRFEPMTAEGRSRFVAAGSRRPWTARHASFQSKFAAVSKRNPAAIILANPPGCADARSESLKSISGGNMGLGVPVFAMSREGAAKLIAAHGGDLAALKARADAGTAVVDLGGDVTLACELERQVQTAENVGAFLRGKGDLADELIVVGAHLDHLGTGRFGSRRGSGKLHPGADDNASGAAAVMMLAARTKKTYDAMPAGASARSILFVGFSAEESGLNGSQYYVNNPIVPLEKHAYMINFDMIGRVNEGRLHVTGTDSARGFGDVLRPLYGSSGLTVVENESRGGGGSDHASFYRREIPILFGINDLHDDYHTPDDVSWKINRVGGVRVIDLFEKVIEKASTFEELEFQPIRRRRREG